MPAGRPTEYRPEYVALVLEMAERGATDQEVADKIGVSVRTIYRWKAEHEDFSQALKAAKSVADERVERSLYERAVGYERVSVKIFCNKDGEITKVPYRELVPPDTTAMIFWLKNRKPKDWRDKSEVDIPGLSSLADRISNARKREV